MKHRTVSLRQQCYLFTVCGMLYRIVLTVLYFICCQFVVAHLSFLQFILQEGGLYLPWHRARDIWDTLVASPQASDWDRDVSSISMQCILY